MFNLQNVCASDVVYKQMPTLSIEIEFTFFFPEDLGDVILIDFSPTTPLPEDPEEGVDRLIL
jgi:hypothetical protein